MRRARLGRLALLGAALSVPPPGAAGDAGVVVSWEQAAAAAEQHPLVLEAKARAGGAAGALTAARELPNPVVRVAGGDASARGGSEHRREWEYSAELPLEFLNGRRQRVAAARANADGAEQEARAVRRQVLRELRRLFVAVAHDQAVLEARTELEAQGARLAALVRRRAERGEIRPTEVPRAEIELEKLRVAVGKARAASEARRQRLGAWLGQQVAGVEADLSRAPSAPPLEELQRLAVESSPWIQAGRAHVAAAEQEASAERWARLPRLTVAGARAEELDRRATTFTAAVTIPLSTWNAGRIRQADAAVAGERARLDAATRALSADLSEAWQGCSGGQAAAIRFRDEILPRAEASAKVLGRAFELGESGLLDVIDARRVLLETRGEYLDLLLEMQNACADLAALAELELP